MKQIVSKGRFSLFRATICHQTGALFQTLRALLILPLNALQTLENHLASCVFAPVHETKSTGAEWVKLMGPDPKEQSQHMVEQGRRAKC
ncbi:MAG TPA: hypothetical protein ENJ90_10400 [Devosia sp.]|nr:hypothetical protein [Devosia sp.]